MNNLLNREEYLEKVNEGFFRDKIKRGIDKVKSLFKIGMKKIKDFITIFDSKGNILPVISLQAVADNFSDVDGIHVYASDEVNKSIVDAGGKGCETKAAPISDDEVYDFGPKGKEFAKWMKEEKYKESNEYKNLMSIPGLIKECYDCSSDEAKELFEGMINEDWENIVKNRVRYHADGKGSKGLEELNRIDVKGFEKRLDTMIKDRIINAGKTIRREDGKVKKPWRNLLVFGAPGIGKSTVPNMVIKKYNEAAASDAEKMALITVDCTNITVGDFMMPTMPQTKNVQDVIMNNPETFPKAKEYLDGLTPEQESKLQQKLDSTKQYEADSAPKSWLPSYRKTGDAELDALLNEYANGGVYTDEDGNTHRTGNGGIIMFDEFLRTDPNVFKQLMIFLLTREMEGWTLGSKWVIIACSNRPCDDEEVESVWDQWSGGPAGKDRFERIVHLDPNPEQWAEWARSKGCDELLLKFIFDKKSMVGDEYPRWHSMVRNSSKQVNVVSPRRWESAFEAINDYEIDNDYDDIFDMSIKEIRECLSDIFDQSFVEEICTWLEDHMDSISLDEIIENPSEVLLPSKYSGKDLKKAGVLLEGLFEQFSDKFKEHPEECTDEKMSNIIIWLGTHYKHDLSLVFRSFINRIDNVLPDDGKNDLHNHKKAMQLMYTAWPQKDTFESIKNDLDDYGEESVWADYKDNYEERVKDLMRKYFPWRLDGDEIIYYDEVNIED